MESRKSGWNYPTITRQKAGFGAGLGGVWVGLGQFGGFGCFCGVWACSAPPDRGCSAGGVAAPVPVPVPPGRGVAAGAAGEGAERGPAQRAGAAAVRPDRKSVV